MDKREQLEIDQKALVEFLRSDGWKFIQNQLNAELRAGRHYLEVEASNLDAMIQRNNIAAVQQATKRFLNLPLILLEDVQAELKEIYEEQAHDSGN